MPLLTLPAAAACPVAVQKLVSCWLVYLVTWGDGHGQHTLHVLYETHVKRLADALGNFFPLKDVFTPFNYWATQGVVLACLAATVCAQARVWRHQHDHHDHEDDEDEEAVTPAAEEVRELPHVVQQEEGVLTRLFATYTVEAEVSERIPWC